MHDTLSVYRVNESNPIFLYPSKHIPLLTSSPHPPPPPSSAPSYPPSSPPYPYSPSPSSPFTTTPYARAPKSIQNRQLTNMAVRAQFENSNECVVFSDNGYFPNYTVQTIANPIPISRVGVFATLTNAYAVVAIGASENFYRFVASFFLAQQERGLRAGMRFEK